MVSGFSQSTGLPCSRHASSCFSCVGPGRGQHDGVDVGIGDGVERVADHSGARHRRGDLFGLLGQVVVHHDDTGVADPAGDAGDVVGAHHADAEHGDA